MKNIEKERLQAKLDLWNTTGFSQFLEDMDAFSDGIVPIKHQANGLKSMYQARINEITESESKFKQGKLPL